MNTQVFKVPDSLERKYHGAGYALASVRDRQLVDIAYLGDVAPDCDQDDINDIERAIADPLLAFAVNRMAQQGEVFFGMLSCWEFVPL